jgi:hypothetical protein
MISTDTFDILTCGTMSGSGVSGGVPTTSSGVSPFNPSSPSASTAFTSDTLSPTTQFTSSLVTTSQHYPFTSTFSSPSSSFTPASPTAVIAAQAGVCLGHGIDVSATGLIATIVLPSAIGLLLWVSKFKLMFTVRLN